ncbi:hypothetical protein SDC9_105317 [bioreactor metagenome]|uniref:Uncharacterized protein n=1 Tax=bioreactor metagenome TaxID=1076179 RepID=A0A645B0B7_9ZZZZ
MNVDVYARVIERERDLINNPWDPKLTISTRPITLTNQIIDLKQRNLTLENAPQGNTCIFPLAKAENADNSHPIEFDLDIPQEAININRVYINLHGRRFRANSKDVKSGGGTALATNSGGGTTSSSNGEHTHLMFTIEPLVIPELTPYEKLLRSADGDSLMSCKGQISTHGELYTKGSSGDHSHTVDSHEHDVEIPDHVHMQSYGIHEGTYPKNVRVIVNGTDIGVSLGDGENGFDEYNIDITNKVSRGNNKVSINTEQNGRIDAIIYSQIFIQAK